MTIAWALRNPMEPATKKRGHCFDSCNWPWLPRRSSLLLYNGTGYYVKLRWFTWVPLGTPSVLPCSFTPLEMNRYNNPSLRKAWYPAAQKTWAWGSCLGDQVSHGSLQRCWVRVREPRMESGGGRWWGPTAAMGAVVPPATLPPC